MFDPRDSWVWDYWFADDGQRYHLFFLYASKALHDPEARHHRASIGHAVSDDLRSWTRIEDALVRGENGSFDDLATWTGSVVRDNDGTWHMFYTGATLAASGQNTQSVGCATSTDLVTWHKSSANPILRPDRRWYETLEGSDWHDGAFRDPWVFADPDGAGWHMLITARAADGPRFGRGVVGHATSADLRRWSLNGPLSEPCEDGFGQLEVMQVEVVEGQPVLVFSCLARHATVPRRSPRGGIWAVNATSVTGPFDISKAYPLTSDDLYVGRLLHRREDNEWMLFAFRNKGPAGAFVGGITDPMPVRWQNDRLTAGVAAKTDPED
ncbi:MAG: glycoside hydrolase family 68 protein [Bifidobacteriaceae bacterium]|jgi:beta-fructofuranosidase|nr:glycoside hydrolase family 68 protein [Bifidobacteriaceae bacterium]